MRQLSFDAMLMAGAIVLVRLPLILGQSNPWPVRWLLLLPFLVSITLNFVRVNSHAVARVDGPLALLYASYLTVVSLSFLRGLTAASVPILVALDNWMVFIVVGAFAFLASLSAPAPGERDRLQLAILVGLLGYLAVNAGLYVLGVRHSEMMYVKALPATMLGAAGIKAYAVLFPMASGINAFGTVGGAAAAMSGTLLLSAIPFRRKFILASIGLGLGIAIMVMTDARLALFLSLATVALIACLRGKASRYFQAAPVLPVVFPLLLIAGLNAVPGRWWDSVGASTRLMMSISNRESVWRAVLHELAGFNMAYVWGFGAYGQITSGLASTYASYFAAYVYSSQSSAHNAFLQQVLETGYIGVGVILGALALTFRRLATSEESQRGRPAGGLLGGFLVFLALIGMVEAAWSPEFQELQLLMLVAIAFTATRPPVGKWAAGLARPQDGAPQDSESTASLPGKSEKAEVVVPTEVGCR